MKNPFRIAIAVAAVVVIGLLVSAPLASAKTTQTQTVDCGMGQSVNQALSMGDFDKPLVVIVRGKCYESVTITRNDVTLRGDYPMVGEVAANTDTSAITVYGASRVAIDRLTVTGGQHGIFVRYARAVSITSSTIRGAAIDGVRVFVGHAQITGSRVINAGQHGIALYGGSAALVSNNYSIGSNARAGIHVERNSHLNANGNTVSENGSNGVEVLIGSVARLSNNTINANGPNPTPGVRRNGVFVSNSTAELNGDTVNANGGTGVQADVSKVAIWNSQIKWNGGHGVYAYLGTVLAIGGGDISNNAWSGVEYLTSMGQISDATIQNNGGAGLHLLLASKLFVREPQTNVAGNGGGVGLLCDDQESSAHDITKLIGGLITCTGF